jgi:hypothetical protein
MLPPRREAQHLLCMLAARTHARTQEAVRRCQALRRRLHVQLIADHL